ncbi:hypothetical protein [Gimesia maris]|uniref:hypothetical protein n=1 Tax=Gimesia maris TaxID=122 RepID=UPI00241F4DEC|nr:hypothetical protein [Gimesia maris]|tara:strand:+ start:92319 stop:92789 length:471 start_codon:yes stop_codon:yes gene_type:complete
MATTEQSEGKSTESLLETVQSLMKKSGGLKLGMMGAGLQSLTRNLNSEDVWNDRTKAAAHKSIYGEEFPTMSTEDEEMHIGDDNSVIHQYLPAPQQSSVIGSLAKLAIGAGLITTGIGVPAGGYMIWDALKNRPTPTAPADPTIDTDTQYSIGLDP